MWHTYVSNLVSSAKRASAKAMNLTLTSTRIKSAWKKPENPKLDSDSINTLLEDDDLNHPRKMNNMGKYFFGLLVVTFNIVFWTVAMIEYRRPADDYIK